MIIWDLEVFKYNFMITWLDTKTRKFHTIHDDRDKFKEMYDKYKNEIWVSYNGRQYDVPVMQAILAGFDPFEITNWIINKGRKGWEFSSLLRNYPILNYDTMIGFRGLKELEGFMGIDIKETSVPFDINRPLTKSEIQEVIEYNKADVWATFLVFLENKHEFESHMGLIKEFNLPLWMISKTKAQISAEILNARRPDKPWDDEFDIVFPDALELGRYEYVKDHFIDWSKNIKDYNNVELKTDIGGIPHVVAIGGLHGARDKYMDTGHFILIDAESYYPYSMVNYKYLSRNVANPKKFETILKERLEMKANKDPREQPRKIVLNSTFGASKDKWNKLYDPRQANSLCIANQLFLIDLIDKLEDYCQIIQSNTDGILIKLYNESDEDMIKSIISEWEERTKFKMSYEYFNKIIQKDVNNYIFVADDYIVTKGAWVKKLSKLDNDLPIVNKAIVDYFTKGISPRETIYGSDKLIDFQKITKISNKYDFGFHENGSGQDVYRYQVPKYRIRKGEKYLSHYEDLEFRGDKLQEKVIRCFASTNPNDGAIYKKHKDKISLDKTAGTPENAFIDNGDITDKEIPSKLDREWYLELVERRIREFIGG